MAKSTRSKTKRAFRSKKRENGVYAAVEAARLQRLNAKLVALTTQDVEGEDEEEVVEDDEGSPGWYWFMSFGLLDPDEVTPWTMEGFGFGDEPFAPSSIEAQSRRPEGVASEKTVPQPDGMEVDGEPSSSTPAKSTKVSTHGPRNSRRESWRQSKGLAPRPKARGMNRQGLVAAKRKSGRPSRRR
ncbi:hypothetical protein DENSPDRAFT_876292 [Dentipellis sp. KUC8613]|nr:hypothetical protein DENSPDRAFT_876292 [Dentipellis sp. KUC8613]